MKVKLIEAQYVKEAQSILYIVEKNDEKARLQVHRKNIAKFGNRSEREIVIEMEKYVEGLNKIYQGKEITIEQEEEE